MKNKTSKKSIAKATPQAPAGLKLAFSLIRESDHTPLFASLTAEEVYPVAQQVIEELQGEANPMAINEIMYRATEQMFEWETASREVPDFVQTAAYYIGFAVCWLQMNDIQGGAR